MIATPNRSSRFPLSIKVLSLVLVPLIISTFMLLFLGSRLKRAEVEAELETHARLLRSQCSLLFDHIEFASQGLINFALTKDKDYLLVVKDSNDHLPKELKKLGELTNNANEKDSFEVLKPLIAVIQNYSSQALNGSVPHEDELRSVWKAREQSRIELRKMTMFEQRAKNDGPYDERKFRNEIKQVVIYGTGINFVVAIALCIFAVRGVLSRLLIVQQNYKRLAAQEKLLAPASGNDEIADIDRGLHEMAAELAKLESMKQDFIAMVSHDLKSPLMSIQATFEMFESNVFGALSEKAMAAITSSQRNLIYLLQLVEQILDVEKLESGKFDLDRSVKPIEPALIRSKQLVADLAQKKGEIQIDIPDTDLTCFMDEDRIVQVLVNLLGNAIKYAPPSSEVHVFVDAINDEKMVEFRISDKGRGIPKGMEKIIFERFQQVDIADWKEKKGSGLGLSICKLIVEAHGGTIGVDSKEGEGSTFWFKLPVSSEK